MQDPQTVNGICRSFDWLERGGGTGTGGRDRDRDGDRRQGRGQEAGAGTGAGTGGRGGDRDRGFWLHIDKKKGASLATDAF